MARADTLGEERIGEPEAPEPPYRDLGGRGIEFDWVYDPGQADQDGLRYPVLDKFGVTPRA